MNAIIIAAGLGSRLRPITNEIPKPLIKIFGKPMIERSIEYLLEANIKEIIIVIGYLKDKFSYLEEKYPEVKLIYNEYFDKYNNIYSFYLVRQYLKDSFILDGDIYLTKNIFKENLENSCYFSKKINYKNSEWQLILENKKIKEIVIGGSHNYIMSGVSFWKKEDSFRLRKLAEEYILNDKYKKEYYWEHIIKDNIERFSIEVKPLLEKDITEIDSLEELKIVDSSYKIKVRMAVILAAGKSREFDVPNGIVKIDQYVLIERSIELLKKYNIENIIIVTGYKRERFKYLTKKYKNITILENEEYDKKGSYFSLIKIKGYLQEDFLLLDSDIIYEEKTLKYILNYPNDNVILVSDEKGQKDESFVEEKSGNLKKISKDIRELKNVQGEMLGISKISYYMFQKILNLDIKNNSFAYEYSISEVADEFNISILKIDNLIWGEIDCKENLKYIKENIIPRLRKIELDIFLDEVRKHLLNIGIDENIIQEIEPIGGMTNKNYLIKTDSKNYVFRNPGIGTDEIICRNNEFNNIKIISDFDFDSKLIYYNEKTGMKLSEYIENAQTLNPITAKKYFKRTTKILKKLHNSNIEFNNRFDVFEEIKKYEYLIKRENAKFYLGYEELKIKVLELEKKLDEIGINLKPCHNDTVPENFINTKEKIYLIDWEYSGMNDPMWDLAAHSIECEFSLEEEKEFLNCYFDNEIPEDEYLKVKIYKVCQDFLWSIWTILKESKGVKFGDYGLMRFKRASQEIKELNI